MQVHEDEPSLNYNSYISQQEKVKKIHSSRNKSFSQFLSLKEASRNEMYGDGNNNNTLFQH
jgi:hypothetical protein